MQVEINIQLTAIETFDEDDIIDLLHSVIKQQATISESKKFTTEDEKTEDKYEVSYSWKCSINDTSTIMNLISIIKSILTSVKKEANLWVIIHQIL